MIWMTLSSTVLADAPGYMAADPDRGRGDRRVLGDGELHDRQGARQHHRDRDDPGEDGAFEEEGDMARPYFAAGADAPDAASARRG